MGIEKIPLRIPEQWSAAWFRQFIVEVLAKLDTRNALGEGIVITSDGNSVATINATDAIDEAIADHDALVTAHGPAITAHDEKTAVHANAFVAYDTTHKAQSDPHTQYTQRTQETIKEPWQFNDDLRIFQGQSGGWRDIIGTPQEPVSGTGKPTWTQIASSGVYTWNYATNDIQYYAYHIPHDYVPGTDIHFHVHWFGSQTAGNYTRWTFDYLYSKGHNQAAFPTTASSAAVEQQQNTTAYTHMIAETAGVTISGLEVDGLILVKVTRVAPTGGGHSDVSGGVFVPVVDLHYKSFATGSTRNKAPDFYGVIAVGSGSGTFTGYAPTLA